VAAITFGTDGVRGRAFEELTLSDAFSIGRAAGDVMSGTHAVVGRDTRESGEALTAAIAAGLAVCGVETLDLGVAPTPAVAFAAARRGCIGAMISASHNPWYDNGIKLFSGHGAKLSDLEQSSIEARLGELRTLDRGELGTDRFDASSLVSLEPIDHELGHWVRSVATSVDVRLDDLTVVLDAANGAASHVVAPALADLGAKVHAIFTTPDGRNINDGCGSTHPQALARAVVEHGADIGLALDGDADRLLAVDHAGRVVDGDHLMAMLAIDMHDRGRLAASTLVVTVMSNLGLLRAMERAGIAVEVTPVGDRNVIDGIERTGASFGGEQSGHLIFVDHGGTGDGFLSSVQVLGLLARSGRSLADLAGSAMTSFPQVLRSVPVVDRMPDIATRIATEIGVVNDLLGADGRVLVRASGTEPVVRVMVEAVDHEEAVAACERLCAAVEAVAAAS
jgi:phosphoglucosamine mutase